MQQKTILYVNKENQAEFPTRPHVQKKNAHLLIH